MKIFISGGSGFIGKNLIPYLIKKYPNYDIVNLDRKPFDFKKKQYRYISGDVRNQELVEKIITEQGTDIIINLVQSHDENAIQKIETDICSQSILLETAVEKKIKHFLYLSSAEIYPPEAQKSNLTEETTPLPHSIDIAHKIATENLILGYFYEKNLPVTLLRATDCLGPWLDPKHMIALLITNSFKNNPIPLYHGGQQKYDFLHINDLCLAIDYTLHLTQPSKQIFNLGWGIQYSLLDITKLILAQTDKDESLIRFLEETPSPKQIPNIDCHNIQKTLKWTPQINLDTTLKNTIEWFKLNPDWWKNL